MTSINFRGKTLTIAYVDTNLPTGSNDGSSPANAFRSFPLFSSLSANTFYLIRRTNSVIQIAKSTNTNNNIQIYGMPLNSELDLYSILPSEVQLAWGGDTYNKVKILLNNTITKLVFAGTDCGLYNIDYVFHDAAYATYSYQGGVIQFNADQVVIKSCSFNVTGANITGSNAITNFVGCIFLDKGDGASIDSCNFIAHNSYGVYLYGSSISNSTINNLNVTNCNFTCVKTSLSLYPYYGIGNLYISPYSNNANITNCNFNYRYYGNSNSYPYCDIQFNSGASNAKLDTLTINTTGSIFPLTDTSNKYNIYIYSTSTGVGNSSNNSLKNITINSSIKKTYTPIYANANYFLTLENVSINVSDIDPATNSYGIYATNCNYINLNNVYVDMCSSITSNNAYGMHCIGSLRGCINNSSINSGGYSIFADEQDIYNSSLTGALRTYARVNEITTLNIGKSTIPNIIDQITSYTSVIHIQNASLSGGITPSISNVGLVIIDSCLDSSPNITVTNNGRIYINNYQYSGFWLHQNAYNRLFSASVVRISGGGISIPADALTYSIRGNGQADSALYPLRAAVIAPKPFNGLTVNTSAMSLTNKTATLYFSSKFVTLTPTDIWFELEIPNGSTGSKMKTISTYQNIDLEADASVWSGDTVTSNKISTTFLLERAENCYARIYYNKFSNLGVTYIDPRIIIS